MTHLLDPTPISPEQTSPRLQASNSSSQLDNISGPITIPNPPKRSQFSDDSKPHVQSQQQPSPITPSPQRILSHNERAVAQNLENSANAARLSTPLQAQPTPMVIIPPSSAEALKSDFVTYEEPPRRDGAKTSRKRKRGSETQLGAGVLQT